MLSFICRNANRFYFPPSPREVDKAVITLCVDREGNRPIEVTVVKSGSHENKSRAADIVLIFFSFLIFIYLGCSCDMQDLGWGV